MSKPVTFNQSALDKLSITDLRYVHEYLEPFKGLIADSERSIIKNEINNRINLIFPHFDDVKEGDNK